MMEMRKVPWLVDEAVEFLKREINARNINNILEFGSGASTIWFSKRVEILVSVEHDKDWYTKIFNLIKPRTGIDLRLRPQPYNTVCKESLPVREFDLVLIDGRDRVACAQSAYQMIRPGGFLMLDNSDLFTTWAPPIFDLLKSWDKITWVQKGPDQEGYLAPEGIDWETTVFKKSISS
jgi:predicted O-methyltransferase YrrM